MEIHIFRRRVFWQYCVILRVLKIPILHLNIKYLRNHKLLVYTSGNELVQVQKEASSKTRMNKKHIQSHGTTRSGLYLFFLQHKLKFWNVINLKWLHCLINQRSCLIIFWQKEKIFSTMSQFWRFFFNSNNAATFSIIV